MFLRWPSVASEHCRWRCHGPEEAGAAKEALGRKHLAYFSTSKMLGWVDMVRPTFFYIKPCKTPTNQQEKSVKTAVDGFYLGQNGTVSASGPFLGHPRRPSCTSRRAQGRRTFAKRGVKGKGKPTKRNIFGKILCKKTWCLLSKKGMLNISHR